MDRPFSGNWHWSVFGFEGEPEAGVDYSWLEVQEGLDFVGREETILGCSLFYSSRRTNTFLVRTQSNEEALWNTIDCTFSIVGGNPSVLSVVYGPHLMHISGVASPFIDLLMCSMKLPLDSLKQTVGCESREMTVLRSTAPIKIPTGASKPADTTDSESVTVNGTDMGEVTGKLTLTDEALEVGSVRIARSDITNTDTSEPSKLVLETSSHARIEITFKDAEHASKISETLAKTN